MSPNIPAIRSAENSTRFIDPKGMNSRVDLSGWCEYFAQGYYTAIIVQQQGLEPDSLVILITSRARHTQNHSTTK